MNNEPVAWRKVVGNVTKHYQYNEMGEGTPLYTHPAKTLTDEEIWGFMDEIEALVHGDIKRAMYRMARKVESILNE
jgi:AAA15 family ATPase/GTPase